MSKVYETLKKKNDTSVEVYPNIERTNIPDGAINTAKVEDNSITTNKIVDSAVTTAKINDGAVTESKLSFHLYEHNIVMADNVDIEEADEVVTFSILSTDDTELDTGDLGELMYNKGYTGMDSMLKASGRYSEDSFEVVTSVDFGAQTDTTDYCETIVIGVYADSGYDINIVVATLSENETTKLSGMSYPSALFKDTVVTIF